MGGIVQTGCRESKQSIKLSGRHVLDQLLEGLKSFFRMDGERVSAERPLAGVKGRLLLLFGGQGRLGAGDKGPMPLQQDRLEVGPIEAGPKVLERLGGIGSGISSDGGTGRRAGRRHGSYARPSLLATIRWFEQEAPLGRAQDENTLAGQLFQMFRSIAGTRRHRFEPLDMATLLPLQFNPPTFPPFVQFGPFFQQLGGRDSAQASVKAFLLLLQLHPGHQGGQLFESGGGRGLLVAGQPVVALQLRIELPALLVQLAIFHAALVKLLPLSFQSALQRLLDGLNFF